MTKLEIFNRLMKKAKEGGYSGPDYKYQLGHILEGTNIYSIIFRDDFAKAIWPFVPGQNYPNFLHHLGKLAIEKDKWKYLEENAI